MAKAAANIEYSSMNANRRLQKAMAELAELNRQAKAINIDKKILVDRVKAAMGDVEDLYNSNGDKLLATFRFCEVTRLDAAQLREDHPKIAEAYTYTEEQRKFLIK